MNTVAPRLTNELANAINENGRSGSPFSLFDCQNKIGTALHTMETHIRWSAQTIHQAYHLDLAETWQTCPRNTCDSAARSLGLKE